MWTRLLYPCPVHRNPIHSIPPYLPLTPPTYLNPMYPTPSNYPYSIYHKHIYSTPPYLYRLLPTVTQSIRSPLYPYLTGTYPYALSLHEPIYPILSTHTPALPTLSPIQTLPVCRHRIFPTVIHLCHWPAYLAVTCTPSLYPHSTICAALYLLVSTPIYSTPVFRPPAFTSATQYPY